MASTKQKCLSFETKLKLIEAVEKGGKTKALSCDSIILKDSKKLDLLLIKAPVNA